MDTKILDAYYSLWLADGSDMPSDRLIWRVSAAMTDRGHGGFTVRQHQCAIRGLIGLQQSKHHYEQYMLGEANYGQLCAKCGGTGRYGYTTGTCYGCSGKGYVK